MGAFDAGGEGDLGRDAFVRLTPDRSKGFRNAWRSESVFLHFYDKCQADVGERLS